MEEEPDVNRTIPVEQLAVGMEVVALDKSWLETNILFHRFKIRSKSEIDKLRENGIRMVTINVADNHGPKEEITSPEIYEHRGKDPVETLPPPSAIHNLEVITVPDLREWNALHNKTVGLLEKSFNDIRMGHILDAGPLRQQVIETLDLLLRDPRRNSFLVTLSEVDDESYIHSANTMLLSMALASQAGVAREDLAKWGLAALLHDVGKALVPLEILKKPGKLTPLEWDTMKRHPGLGHSILSRNKDEVVRGLCATVAIEHHERKGGTGYPHGFDLPALDPVTRSLMVLDIYEALTAGRVYRPPLSPAKTMAYLLDHEIHRLDPRAVVQLVQMIGIYPVGSLVKLTNGMIALISSYADPDNHTGPVSLLGLFSGRQDRLSVPVQLTLPSIEKNHVLQTFHPKELGLSPSDIARYLEMSESGFPGDHGGSS